MNESWWQVIEAMSVFVACGFDYEELEDDFVHYSLLAEGFLSEDIEKALDWLEMASIGGNVADVFSMLQPQGIGTRVASPLEKVCLSDKVWHQFEKMRRRGLLGDDLAERVLEGMRSMDTRDWEDEEVHSFLSEVLASALPHASASLVRRLVARKRPVRELYS